MDECGASAAHSLAGFADLVRQMRAKQREYFSTRDRAVLIASKGLEVRVDAAIDILEQRGMTAGNDGKGKNA